jgi:hypothetical protein
VKVELKSTLGIVSFILTIFSGLPIAVFPAIQEGTCVCCTSDRFVFSQNLVLARRADEGVATDLYKATDNGWLKLSAPSFYEVKAAPDGTIYVLVASSGC